LNIVFIATTILANYFIGNTLFLYSRYWHPKIYEKAPRKAGSHR
jgi:hypothetical protein